MLEKLAQTFFKKALENLDRSKNISVSTFREDEAKGIALRSLYKKISFGEVELIEEFGYPNQRFVLHKN